MIIRIMISLAVFLSCERAAFAQVKTLKIEGASTLVPMFQEIGSQFGPSRKMGVSIKSSGSEAGIECAKAMTCDIGLSSRALKPAELEGVEAIRIGWDGAAILVNVGAGITALSSKQITDVFNGKVKSWKEVGGNDVPIAVFQREKGRGLRDIFDKLFSVKSTAQEVGTHAEIINRLRREGAGGIGYASLGLAVREPLKDLVVLKIDGVDPTIENVRSGKYLVKRELVMIRNKKTAGDPVITDFVDFSLNAAKELVSKFDFIEK